jgi:hypothetical protein
MNIKDFSQPTILKGKQYGTTITIELDHSDTSIDEVMDGFLTIVKGLGYLDSTINEWIKEKSKDIYDDEHQIVKDALRDDFQIDWFNDISTDEEDCGCNNEDEDYDGQFKDWDNETPIENEWGNEDDEIDWDEDRIDIIGQNGNEGTHYDTDMGIATDEDIEECKLNEELETPLKDYKGIYVERPHFDWNDEELDWPVANDKLKAAAQKYSDEVKGKHKSVKFSKEVENEFDADGGFNSPLYKRVKKAPNTPVTPKKMTTIKKNIKKTSKSRTKNGTE